jgi:predicted  nucleic acid-binding Zn-ribbon protein
VLQTEIAGLQGDITTKNAEIAAKQREIAAATATPVADAAALRTQLAALEAELAAIKGNADKRKQELTASITAKKAEIALPELAAANKTALIAALNGDLTKLRASWRR